MNLKKTIKLQELKVISFITSITKEGQNKIYGGVSEKGCSGGPNCKSEDDPAACLGTANSIPKDACQSEQGGGGSC